MITSEAKDNGRKRHLAVDADRAAAGRADHRRLRSGPRRREAAAVEPAQRVPLASSSPGPTAATPASSSPGRRQSSSRRLTLQVVKRTEPHTFQVLPRRWVVERTFGLDHPLTGAQSATTNASPDHHETDVYWAMIIIMTRRLARPPTAV